MVAIPHLSPITHHISITVASISTTISTHSFHLPPTTTLSSQRTRINSSSSTATMLRSLLTRARTSTTRSIPLADIGHGIRPLVSIHRLHAAKTNHLINTAVQASERAPEQGSCSPRHARRASSTQDHHKATYLPRRCPFHQQRQGHLLLCFLC